MSAVRIPPTLRTATSGETPADAAQPPTADVIRALIAHELYDDAMNELQYAQRVWGDTPPLQATTAWIRYRQGLGLRAQDRFTAIRGAITTMRRARSLSFSDPVWTSTIRLP